MINKNPVFVIYKTAKDDVTAKYKAKLYVVY